MFEILNFSVMSFTGISLVGNEEATGMLLDVLKAFFEGCEGIVSFPGA